MNTGIAHRARRFAMWVGSLVLLLTLTGVPGSAASASPATGPSTKTVQAFMTLYGYVDNSPPGTIIAHPCIHPGAGGVGTFGDPITFATDVHELPWCKIIYVPYMERYFIHEDECSECDADWARLHVHRFDMWAGGDSDSVRQPERRALLQCEDTWTRANSPNDPANPTIIVNPPADLPVTTDPIFSPATSCWRPITVANPGDQTTALPAKPVDVQVHGVDTSPGRTLGYQAVGLPRGLSIDRSTGLISGTPVVRQRSQVVVTATDSYNSVSIRFRWSVESEARM